MKFEMKLEVRIQSWKMPNEIIKIYIQVLMQWEVTHKIRELRYLKRVKVDRSFLQKTFHIMEQKETTIIKIFLLRQLK